MQYWSKQLRVAQYLDSWLSDLLQSELRMKLLEVETKLALGFRMHLKSTQFHLSDTLHYFNKIC